MTETPHQERENPGPETPPAGMDREHLRDYTALRRTTYDRKIAGVAGGIARHLNIDPVIVRVLFVVLVFFGGAGLVLYGAAWLIVPEDTGKPAPVRTSDSTRNTLLIIAAVFAALLVVGDSWGGTGFPWWLVPFVAAAFIYLMIRDNRGSSDPVAPGGQAAWQPPTGAPAYGPPAYAASVPPVGPMMYTGSDHGWQPVDPTVAPPRKRGPLLFGPTMALVLVGLGVLGLIDASGAAVPDAAYPALALGLIGLMLVVGSFFGRPGGLILAGIVAAVTLAGTALGDPSYGGDRTLDERPTQASEVDERYYVPAGQITLDLTGVRDVTELDGRTIEVEAQAGELLVILPEGVRADLDADITFGGAITLPGGDESGGFGRSINRSVGSSSTEATTIDLIADLKFGHIEVRYQQ